MQEADKIGISGFVGICMGREERENRTVKGEGSELLKRWSVEELESVAMD